MPDKHHRPHVNNRRAEQRKERADTRAAKNNKGAMYTNFQKPIYKSYSLYD